MAWVKAMTGEDYVGPVHEFLGKVYSGETRTVDSVRLIEVPKAKPVSQPIPRTRRKKGVVSKRAESE